MNLLHAVILGCVQGITEFIPVSSSGHLVLFQKLLSLSEPPILFDIVVHGGTLCAVCIVLRRELQVLISGFFRGDRESRRIALLVIVGTLPAVGMGIAFSAFLEESFNSVKTVAVGFLITSGILFLPLAGKRYFIHERDSLFSLGYSRAFLIGCAQALALAPGISRSGSTITAGLGAKLRRNDAFLYSFYLFIPAVIGAHAFSLINNPSAQLPVLPVTLAGFITSAVVGYFALSLLRSTLLRGKFWIFGIYCLALGIIVLVLSK